MDGKKEIDDKATLGILCLSISPTLYLACIADYLFAVSNVCEAAPISLFWAPNGLNKQPERPFEFPFDLNGQLI